MTINTFVFSGGPAANGTLYPGATVTVAFHVNNASSNTKVKVGQVVIDGSFGGGTGITGLPVGCLAADFTYTNGTAINAEINPSSFAAVTDGALTMANTGVNQDLCKSAAPVLHLKIDNTGL